MRSKILLLPAAALFLVLPLHAGQKDPGQAAVDRHADELAKQAMKGIKKHPFRDLARKRSAKEISIGMTRDQVRASLGRPWHTATSITADRTIETWSYGSSFVFFESGVVTAIDARK